MAAQPATNTAVTGLRVAIEYPLPDKLTAGRATALFIYGHCFDVRCRVTGFELLVGGRRHRPDAWRMPRLDLLRWLQQIGEDPNGHSYRSGWWCSVAIPSGEAVGRIRLAAVVGLDDGTEVTAELGELEFAVDPAQARPATPPLPKGTIAVCMATFEPEPALFAAQVQSLREQHDERWVCVISDGGSHRDRLAEMRSVLAGDQRFVLSASERRLDPYHNFERALALAPAGAEYVALSDQDDRWYPDKLGSLRAALGTAALVYSDMRMVSAGGRVIRDSFWTGRRHDRTNLASLLVANVATGAAMLFRRTLLERALPFPDVPGAPFHDHWLALTALAEGTLAYVDRALYDYVQHDAGVHGAITQTPAAPHRQGSHGWRDAYFGGYVQRKLQAQTLLARQAEALDTRKRRALELMIDAERSPVAFAWLALRPLRRLWGRDETLGGEVALACGIVWRRLVAAAAGRERPGSRPWDASFPDPPEFEQRRLRRWRAAD
jgi:hypothetical protein